MSARELFGNSNNVSYASKLNKDASQYVASLREQSDRYRASLQVLEDTLDSIAKTTRDLSPGRRNIHDSSLLSDAATPPRYGLAASPVLFPRSTTSTYRSSSPLRNKSCVATDAEAYQLKAQLVATETGAIRQMADTIAAEKKADDYALLFEEKSLELEKMKDLLYTSNRQAVELENLLALRPVPPGPVEREALEDEISRLRLQLETSRASQKRLLEVNREMNMEVTGLKLSLEESMNAYTGSALLASEVPRLHAEIKNCDNALLRTKMDLQDSHAAIGRLGREFETLKNDLKAASLALTVSNAREAELDTVQSLYAEKLGECNALQIEIAQAKGDVLLLESKIQRHNLGDCCHSSLHHLHHHHHHHLYCSPHHHLLHHY